MDLTYKDIVEILQIVDASGFSHLTIEDGSFRLSISRGSDGLETTVVSGNGAAAESREASKAETIAESAPPVPPANGGPRKVNVGGLELAVTARKEQVQVSATAVPVPSPMLGVFYRRPSPDAPPFVEMGQRVAAGDTVCLVESMKMFMPVPAPVDGVVASIPVENKELVEFNQPLMWLEPEGAT